MGECARVPGPRFELFPAVGPGTNALAADLPQKVYEREARLRWQTPWIIRGAKPFPVRMFRP